ncbi:dTDP-4-dehydrorhamnose 3,5-epimerase [Lacibacter cauensis]|uniref:dTDP-4-dehydrorhamnose 3,5-epimerase n=1 Tax=Lacibacter cauensis TaxID=510947 RepID=A0A562SCN3_9BACT|nr:dTDP-4-dehydrorhamnose 3,5-epimerase [Lacibacter cauensis]TWI79097.1 dTDP-4-dehydrorhamnose 3,5-epimerase [Lacibacter cauensis]
MAFLQTGFPGLVVFEPNVFGDERGYFFESYNQQTFEKEGLFYNWVQDNQSSSTYGVIRGLHFQKGEHAQAKLVRCLSGRILDVVVDLRKDSPTFKQVYAVELTAEKKNALLVPRGFAHGFSVLSETAEVLYKCDNFYNKQSEGGLLYNDATLQIDWRIEEGKEIISGKDQLNAKWAELDEDSLF